MENPKTTIFPQLKNLINFTKERLVIKKSYPKYLILFVTSACNANCGHCFYYSQNRNLNHEELGLDTIKHIASSINKLQILTITGGEPFLRNDLPQIAEIFYRDNKTDTIHIATNGLLPAKIKTVTENILSTCNCNITLAISLDGLGDRHDIIRGVKNAFNSVIETYEQMKILKLTYPNFTLAVNTVISNKNYDDLPKIIQFVKDNFDQIDIHDFDWIRAMPQDASFGLPSLQQLAEIKDILMQTARYYYSKKKSKTALMISLGLYELLFDLRYGVVKEKRRLRCLNL